MNRHIHILAKPSGITLDQHKQNVMQEGRLVLEQLPLTVEKYKVQVDKDLFRRLELVCRYHDDGKEFEPWQSACVKDYEAFLAWKEDNKGDFSTYCKAFSEEAGKNIRKAAVRHEFKSLQLVAKKQLPNPLLAAIAAHHGKLGFRFEDRWINEGASSFWTIFRRESNRLIESDPSGNLEQIAKTHYEYAGLRGLLRLADHRASVKEDGGLIPDLNKFQYKFPHTIKRGVQNLIEKHWNNDLLLVRAPTGAGKTDASLLWASLQIQNMRADRLVIAMPTRFTSNALAISVAESLSDTGLYHSSAWFSRFKEKVKQNLLTKREAGKIHELARLLQTPITVCTIDHLLIALTLTREDHHLISFSLANACLVIDEADFYDDFTQANILVLLEILRYWNVPILLMSASLPESVIPSYQKIGYKVNTIIEDTSDNARDRFEIKSIRKYSNFSEIEDILNLCIAEGAAIIYINTVDKAIMLYNWFVDRKIKPIIYHSRFTEPDKEAKEQELIDALGKEAWKNKSAKGIAILTQIGEMSINISADVMISELCPIDRLTQRTGRLCRFDKSKVGKLHIVVPLKNDCIYPAPYGEYNRESKTWISCEAFEKTAAKIETTFYSANKLVEFINEVYSEQTLFSSKAITNATILKEYFSYNWLINPKQVTLTDDTDTNFWKSRNIEAQDTVYTVKPESKFFNNDFDFQDYKFQNSLELPVCLIEKGKKQGKISSNKIWLKDDEVHIYIIEYGFYNNKKGVSFIEEDQFL